MIGTIIFVLCSTDPTMTQELTDEVCLECHSDGTLIREEGKRVGTSVYMEEGALEGSVHEDLECVTCHADLKEIPHRPTLMGVSRVLCKRPSCPTVVGPCPRT